VAALHPDVEVEVPRAQAGDACARGRHGLVDLVAVLRQKRHAEKRADAREGRGAESAQRLARLFMCALTAAQAIVQIRRPVQTHGDEDAPDAAVHETPARVDHLVREITGRRKVDEIEIRHARGHRVENLRQIAPLEDLAAA
jgi:hypothetical protein